MPAAPWWIEKVRAALSPAAAASLELGPLWRLRERLQFIRENVEAALLDQDFAAVTGAREVWAAFELRHREVTDALTSASDRAAASLRAGALTPEQFRASWEGLGFRPHEDGAGTLADDHLDGLLELVRLALGDERPVDGNLNVSSRAERVSDFLIATAPSATDVVFDLGAGSGKLALTVAASTRAQVRGVELGASYVAAARRSAERLGLGNATFEHCDVRDADLSSGSIFFLYFPFSGAVARAVAEKLGGLARTRPITIYAAGPESGFGQHFTAQVAGGALVLAERRGEFGDTRVLHSAHA